MEPWKFTSASKFLEVGVFFIRCLKIKTENHYIYIQLIDDSYEVDEQEVLYNLGYFH